MNTEVEEKSLIRTSSLYVMSRRTPPRLFWDLEQRKDGKGWDDVAKMPDLPLEYQRAACFLADEDKKKYAPLVFSTGGRLRKKYKNLKPFNDASREFCYERALEARKNV